MLTQDAINGKDSIMVLHKQSIKIIDRHKKIPCLSKLSEFPFDFINSSSSCLILHKHICKELKIWLETSIISNGLLKKPQNCEIYLHSSTISCMRNLTLISVNIEDWDHFYPLSFFFLCLLSICWKESKILLTQFS